MQDINIIVQYIISLAPSIVAIGAALMSALGILKQFNGLRTDVIKDNRIKDLEERVTALVEAQTEGNARLLREIKESNKKLSRKIDATRRK